MPGSLCAPGYVTGVGPERPPLAPCGLTNVTGARLHFAWWPLLPRPRALVYPTPRGLIVLIFLVKIAGDVRDGVRGPRLAGL